MQEICIILKATLASKPKYALKMLRQVYIFNTKVADYQFPKIYLTNTLVNSEGFFYTFYEVNFLFEYQNDKLKYFCSNKKFLL